MKNLAYQVGNKKAALVTAHIFLKINGYRLQRISLLRDSVRDDLAVANVAVATNQLSRRKIWGDTTKMSRLKWMKGLRRRVVYRRKT